MRITVHREICELNRGQGQRWKCVVWDTVDQNKGDPLLPAKFAAAGCALTNSTRSRRKARVCKGWTEREFGESGFLFFYFLIYAYLTSIRKRYGYDRPRAFYSPICKAVWPVYQSSVVILLKAS